MNITFFFLLTRYTTSGLETGSFWKDSPAVKSLFLQERL